MTDFKSKRLSLILICKSLWYFLPSFKSVGLSCQENKYNIDFKDDGWGGHLGFPIGKILNIFDLQVFRIFPSKCLVSGLSVQQKKRKIVFQDGGHGGYLRFSIRTFLVNFDLRVIQLNFESFGLSVQEKFKIYFQWASGIYNRNDFNYFWFARHHNISYKISNLLAFGLRRRRAK